MFVGKRLIRKANTLLEMFNHYMIYISIYLPGSIGSGVIAE